MTTGYKMKQAMILLPTNLVYYFSFTESYLQINLPDFVMQILCQI